jgi:hypothetical protein
MSPFTGFHRPDKSDSQEGKKLRQKLIIGEMG